MSRTGTRGNTGTHEEVASAAASGTRDADGRAPVSAPAGNLPRYALMLAASLSAVLRPPATFANAVDDRGLTPGADATPCQSALRVGLVTCPAPIAWTPAPGGAAPGAGPVGASPAPLEAQVDAYLANYGKPPREAVRALLDPSDDNIRAYLRQQQATLALVSYVATRMSALQAADARPAGAPPLSGPTSAFLQVRVTLVTIANDPQAGAALRALRQLALQEPALQAGVAIVGPVSSEELRRQIAHIEPPLVATITAAATGDAPDLPLVRIEDLRGHRSAAVDARGITAQALARAILAVRHRPDSAEPDLPASAGSGAMP